MQQTFILLSSKAAFYLQTSMTSSRKLLRIPLFTFKLLWPGPGMSNVCVSPPACILLSFKALRLKGEKEFIERQNKRKGGGWGRVTSGPWKPGCSHQATNRSSFKAWQGVVRSTEREGMGVCDREMCVWIHLCLWGCSHTSWEHTSAVLHIVYLCPALINKNRWLISWRICWRNPFKDENYKIKRRKNIFLFLWFNEAAFKFPGMLIPALHPTTTQTINDRTPSLSVILHMIYNNFLSDSCVLTPTWLLKVRAACFVCHQPYLNESNGL